jgi:hypothetical protein
MGLEQTITSVLSSSPLALVLFWMVWVSNKKIDQKDALHKEMTDKVLTAFDNNTKAITSFEKTQEENTVIIKTLTEKVYDVLTKRP